MKKFFAITLAAAMTMAMATTAFAAETVKQDGGTTNISVNGKYEASQDNPTISVIVAWDAMNFTYEAGSKGTWNATTHKYDDAVAAGWKEESKEITVTNHSNTDISAAFDFAGNNGIKGNFTKKTLELVSANTAPYAGTTNAPSGKTAFSIAKDSPAISAETDLGTITVTITGIEYTVVNDATALETALKAGGNIKLGSNIELPKEINTINENTVMLNLNGKTLTASDNLYLQNVIVKDSVGGGTLTTPQLIARGNFTLYSGTINGYVDVTKNATIHGGTISQNGDDLPAFCVRQALTMTGGEISGNSTVNIFEETSIINISGGSIKGRKMTFNNGGNGGTVTITGGTVEGQCNIGNLNVDGGKVTGELNATGDVVITNGEVTGSFWLNGKLTVSGGKTTIEDGYILDEIEVSGGTLTITSCMFDKDPTQYMDENVYDISYSEEESYWTVSKKQ